MISQLKQLLVLSVLIASVFAKNLRSLSQMMMAVQEQGYPYFEEDEYFRIESSASIIGTKSDGRLLVGQDNGESIAISKNQEIIAEWTRKHALSSVAIGDSLIALANYKSYPEISTWDGEIVMVLDDLFYKSYDIQGMDFSQEDEYFAIGGNYFLDLYRVNEGFQGEYECEYFSFQTQENYEQITDVKFSKDNKLLAAASDNFVVIYPFFDGEIGEPIRIISFDGEDSKIAFSDEYLAVATGSEFVQIYNLESVNDWYKISVGGIAESVSFSENGDLLVVGTDQYNGVKIFQTENWAEIEAKFNEEMIVFDVAFSEEKLYVSGCYLEDSCRITMLEQKHYQKEKETLKLYHQVLKKNYI